MLEQINFEVTLSGNGQTINRAAKGGSTIKTAVSAGHWIVSLKAFYQGKLYATGSNSVDVKAGQNNSCNVTMRKAYLEMITLPPPGASLSFIMGWDSSTNAAEKPERTVTFSSGFKMSKYEITQGQWKAVMGNDDRIAAVNSGANYGRGDNYPMYYVSWYDAIVFCNKLSMMEGLTPAYRINGSTDPAAWGAVPASNNATWNAVTVVAGSTGYRLPTEAQWEYACRAGTTTRWSYGDTADGDYMWYAVNDGGSSHEAGTKLPNSWGLHDMHGNVYEMCWDWYSSTYYGEAGNTDDPTGPSSVPDDCRVSRGGRWGGDSNVARSAYRVGNPPNFFNQFTGFRVVLP